MDETLRDTEETTQIRRCIAQLNAGDASYRGELINIATRQLLDLTSRLRRDFQAIENVRSDEDIFHRASIRLYEALHDASIRDTRHFYRIAAIHVRRELIQMCRECLENVSDQQRTKSLPLQDRPSRDALRTEIRDLAIFHDCVESLPQPQREVFELVWYHHMTREEAAELMGIPTRNLGRLWRSARLCLHERMVNKDFESITGDE